MPEAANDDGPVPVGELPGQQVIRGLGPLDAFNLFARSLEAACPAMGEDGAGKSHP